MKNNRNKRKKRRLSKDIFSKKKRSNIMSAIKSKNTVLEKTIFSFLLKRGLKFETHYVKIIGKPDIAIPSKKKVVFIDSNFWHGWQYPRWKHRLTSDFWTNKIEVNRKRDKKVNRVLKRQRWKVLRIWEHNLNKDALRTISKIEKFLKK